MRTDELLAVLADFHRDKLALRQRHVAVARQVAHYDANNTYQYVITREDVHLSWLESAIVELEGTPDNVAEPPLTPPGVERELRAARGAGRARHRRVRQPLAAAARRKSRTPGIAT